LAADGLVSAPIFKEWGLPMDRPQPERLVWNAGVL